MLGRKRKKRQRGNGAEVDSLPETSTAIVPAGGIEVVSSTPSDDETARQIAAAPESPELTKARARFHLPSWVRLRVLAMVELGYSYRQIEAILKVSKDSVTKIVRESPEREALGDTMVQHAISEMKNFLPASVRAVQQTIENPDPDFAGLRVNAALAHLRGQQVLVPKDVSENLPASDPLARATEEELRAMIEGKSGSAADQDDDD